MTLEPNFHTPHPKFQALYFEVLQISLHLPSCPLSLEENSSSQTQTIASAHKCSLNLVSHPTSHQGVQPVKLTLRHLSLHPVPPNPETQVGLGPYKFRHSGACFPSSAIQAALDATGDLEG